jgi:TfoX/Sxy family transcriptional regulator of competence genes
MASTQKTVDYILEQIAGAGEVSARKMFGEYAVYFGEKTVALVCDNELFVKQTDAGRELLPDCVEKPPFSGAKPWFFISGELWEDGNWLTKLIKVTAAQLPEPAAKKPKKKRIKS